MTAADASTAHDTPKATPITAARMHYLGAVAAGTHSVEELDALRELADQADAEIAACPPAVPWNPAPPTTLQTWFPFIPEDIAAGFVAPAEGGACMCPNNGALALHIGGCDQGVGGKAQPFTEAFCAEYDLTPNRLIDAVELGCALRGMRPIPENANTLCDAMTLEAEDRAFCASFTRGRTPEEVKIRAANREAYISDPVVRAEFDRDEAEREEAEDEADALFDTLRMRMTVEAYDQLFDDLDVSDPDAVMSRLRAEVAALPAPAAPFTVPPAPGAAQALAAAPDVAGSAENPGPDAAGSAEQSESDAQAAAQAAAEAHMAAADAPELLDAVFCTDLLKEIRARAAKAQVSPMLALSANIGGLLSVVPYQVCLPKLVGKRRQPLNLITVPIDESGGGKGGATTVDIDPIPAQRGQRFVGLPSDAVAGAEGVEKVRRIPIPVPAGSGEAMAEGYAHMEKCEHTGEKISVNHNESAWFAWDEVGKILAVRDRKGSTIEPELCHGWSWETLGSKTKTNPFWVEPRTYRMLVTICAQLVTAAGLLADEYTGLVQRIWWVSAAYTIDEEDAAPEKLAAGRRDETGDWFAEPDDEQPLIRVELPEWPADGVLRVAASVAAEIEAARADHGRGRKSHPWDRHQFLIRLRLAAAGAIMHGCADVTAEWWAWAGLLIEHSKHVRDAVVALRGTAATKVATDAGKSDAIRAEARSTAQWRRAVDSTEKWAEEQLGSRPDSLGRFTLNQAKRAAGPGFRKDNMSDILAALIQVGKLMPDVMNVPSAGGDVVYYRFLPKKG
ncbi:hypothetical protein D2E65_16080 [Mycobacteroides abscessus]|uniref:hypothetical protein n=1 Tax=Mycobacteroides abscessus TaxID=36809 RepID=UPI000E689DA6|nr:hypothetical protein [Mycobacteroides abscessus]RIR77095.1 hypothetical protein D2E65_16080 [Mycobacteroides abscessus]